MNTLTEIAEIYRAAMRSNQYRRMPSPAARDAYTTAAMHYQGAADQIRRTIDVYEVAGQPYETAAEQWDDIARGCLLVSLDFCDHQFWTPAQNINYRIVHDYNDHRPLHGRIPEFTTEGELYAWNHRGRLTTVPRSVGLVRFSETIGQLAYVDTFGKFPDQRHAGVLLPQFDPTTLVLPH